jgi:hypothetical protein
LLAARTCEGFWVGELSSSGLASATAVSSIAATGQRNWRLRFPGDARRQAMSGPIPVKRRSRRPSGTFT